MLHSNRPDKSERMKLLSVRDNVVQIVLLQGVKFLFFPIFWPASYFLLFFQEIPIFSYFF